MINKNNSNNWIQTYSSKIFYPLNPTLDSICIEDIAHALSMMCRFNGHSNKFYSVCDHSILVCKHVPKKYKLTALLHDASEAYIADIARPIKPLIAGYKDLETSLEKIISERFNLIYPLPEIVKNTDFKLLGDEKRLLMNPEPSPWTLDGQLGLKRIICHSPKMAEKLFLKQYYKLIQEKQNE